MQRTLRTVHARGHFRAYATASSGETKKTPLYEFHKKHGGRMVEFGGWSMPVQYSNLGMIDSHLHTRTSASLFDVSHMLQLRFHGKDRVKFIESLAVGAIQELAPGTGTLTLLTNERGGIKDDSVVNNAGSHLYVVCNAGCADKDLAHFQDHLQSFGGDVSMEIMSANGLVALQGPMAASALAQHTRLDLAKMPFMSGADAEVAGVPCRVTRCGYTGEDGFEISIPADKCVHVCEALLQNPSVQLAGLGARDSLRLEAGLCLYGHDIDEETTPIEASLAWTIGARRRSEGGFLGSEIILEQLKTQGGTKRRVGMVVTGAPAREGTVLTDESGNEVGVITSGGPSPCLKQNIAMGYINKPHNKLNTKLLAVVRKRSQEAVVTKMPFVPTHYYKPAQ